MKILDKEVKLNQILSIGYLNNRGYWEIASGRLYDYDKDNVWLDISYDFLQLEDTLKVKKDSIKYLAITADNMWR